VTSLVQSIARPAAALGRRRPVRVVKAPVQAAWLALLWAALGALVTLAVLTSLSPLFGLRAFTVLTGSMRPSIDVGAIVFDRPIAPAEARRNFERGLRWLLAGIVDQPRA